jgi:HSP20 family protein
MFYINKSDNDLQNFFNYGRTNFMSSDVIENDNSYTVKVNMPGIDKKDIKISLEDQYLTVEYERKESHEDKKKYIRRERFYESQSRSFYLGKADSQNVKASLENGILTIEISKKAHENKSNIIEIE